MTVPQMQQAAQEGAYIEFTYSSVFGPDPHRTISEFAEGIRKVGPKFCILGTNFGASESFLTIASTSFA